MQITGTIVFSRSAIERISGYGLEYDTSFNDTHLGIL
ncbi:DUF4260 family protein [Gelidibacter japonicus]